MNGIKVFTTRHALILYTLLTYAISFSLFSVWDWASDNSIPWFTYGPMLAALLLTVLAGGLPALKALLGQLMKWRVGWHWYAIALGVPTAIGLGAIWLATLAGLPAPSAAQWARWPTLFMAFPIRLIFSGPFGEELGWRGFALPRLQGKYAPLTASLILGAMGAIWHLPLYFIGENQWPDMILIFAGYILINWVYNGTNGSVLLALLFHGVTNTLGGAFLSRLYTGVDALPFSIWHTVAWIVAALIVVVATGTKLGYRTVENAQIAPTRPGNTQLADEPLA